MSAARPDTSFDSLTERELAILRLLASGHTVKSVAAELDASEASINERLRDARRKTGVSSSRELARLLDAQKTWDRKIDLPDGGVAGEPETRPASDGPSISKGRLAMLLIIPVAAAALITVAAPLSHQPETPPVAHEAVGSSPLMGSWELDVSRIPEGERPTRVTFTFHRMKDKWATHIVIVTKDGIATHSESVAATDGVPVPVTGTMAFVDTVALRQPSPNSLVMTLAKAGAPVSTRVYTVAKDRNWMTETIVWERDTSPRIVTTYFRRVG